MADAEIHIHVRVNKSGDEIMDSLLDDIKVRIRRSVGSCKICRANSDPDAIPLHPNCRCRAEIEIG